MRYLMVNKWKYVLIASSLFFVSQLDAQPTYSLLAEIPVQATVLETDVFGNCYLADRQNRLYKYSSMGELLATYHEPSMGSLKVVDATNPLKILIYYPDYGNIVTLDNYLAKLGVINLPQAGILDVEAIGLAADNNIWVFDKISNSLKKLDETGQVISESEDLTTFGLFPKPSCIRENTERVYVNDLELGIFVFDIFNSYINQIHEKGINQFQIIGQNLLFLRKGLLYNYNLKDLSLSEVSLPSSGNLKIVSIQQQYLFVADASSVRIYKY